MSTSNNAHVLNMMETFFIAFFRQLLCQQSDVGQKQPDGPILLMYVLNFHNKSTLYFDHKSREAEFSYPSDSQNQICNQFNRNQNIHLHKKN